MAQGRCPNKNCQTPNCTELDHFFDLSGLTQSHNVAAASTSWTPGGYATHPHVNQFTPVPRANPQPTNRQTSATTRWNFANNLVLNPSPLVPNLNPLVQRPPTEQSGKETSNEAGKKA